MNIRIVKAILKRMLVAVLVIGLGLSMITPDAYGRVGQTNTNGVDPEPAITSIYVAPDGDDEGSGSIDSPYLTLHTARDAVRALISEGMTQDVVVYLREGIYRQTVPFQLTDEDSGRDGYKVVYRGFPGEEAIIDGSQLINGWTHYAGNIYAATVGTGIDVDVIYEGDERAVLARYPNRMDGKDVYSQVAAYIPDQPRRKFGYTETDIPAIAHPEQLQVYIWPGGAAGHWSWSSNIVDVESIDTTNRIVTLAQNTTYENGAGSRYYVQNALELLDAPGEFYIDQASGVLYYYPFDIASLNGQITIPREGNIVELLGTSSAEPIQHIAFESLVIRNSDRLGDGVHAENVENFTITNSRLYNLGEHGIQLLGWAKNNRIESNEIHHTGYNGISVEGIGRVTSVSSSHNDALNNHVYTTGLFYGNAGGIRYYYSESNQIAYNLVHDIKRHALHLFDANRGIIGTTIGGVPITQANFRDYQRTRDNVVAFNEVYDAVNDSQDAGPIATYGVPFGNVLRNNYLHDNTIPATTSNSFGFGIYLDDASDNVTIENNIIENLQQQPGGTQYNALMLKGLGIKVANNVIANNNDARGAIGSTETGGLVSSQISLDRNLIYNLSQHLYYLDYWTPEKLTSSDYNLFHRQAGSYTFGSTIPVSAYEDWLALYNGKYDQHSLRTDPLFMDEGQRDYRLRYDSPAYRLGFQELNIADMGLRADYPFADLTDPIARVIPRFAGDDVDRSFVQLNHGQKRALSLTVRTVTGYVADLSDAEIAFVSDNPSVATVSSGGEITAIQEGVAEITATVTKDGVAKSAVVHVLVDDELVDIGINGPDIVYVNTPVTMDVYGISKHGAYYDLANADVQYTIASTSIAGVQGEGVVTGIEPGEAAMTVVATVGGVPFEAEQAFQVKINTSISTEFDDWSTVNGSWQIVEDDDGTGNFVYRSLTTSGSSRALRNDLELENFAISARVRIDEEASAVPARLGLMGRYQDGANFYYAFYEINTQRFKIMSVTSGVQTLLRQSSVRSEDFTSAFRQLALVFDGDQISLALDGDVVLTATDTSHASGKPGLYAYSQPVAYDDITIHTLLDGEGEGALPGEWNLKHYGTQAVFGVYHATEERFTLEASGADVWGNADQFGYLYQWVEMPVGGKVTLTARLDSLDPAVPASMAGVMMRGADSTHAQHVFARIIAGGNHQVTARQSSGGSTAYQSIAGIGMPTMLKLVREGDVFTASYKKDGADWIQHSTWTVVMPDEFMVGMAVSARHAADYAKAAFSDVSIEIE